MVQTLLLFIHPKTATSFKKQKLLETRNRHNKRDFNALVSILGMLEDAPPIIYS